MRSATNRAARGIPIAVAMAVLSCATTDPTTAAPQSGSGKPVIEGAASPQSTAESALSRLTGTPATRSYDVVRTTTDNPAVEIPAAHHGATSCELPRESQSRVRRS